jgi:hypothetical protein
MSYTPPRFDAIRTQLVSDWKLKFGANADTSSDTIDGLLVDIFTLGINKCYQALAQINAQNYIATAEGSAVDALLHPLFLISRLAAAPTTCEVWLYGDTATTVTVGSTVATLDTGASFTTDAEVIIGPSSFFVLTFPAVVAPTVIGVSVGAITTPVSVTGLSALEVADEVAQALTLLNTNVSVASVVGVQPNGDAIVIVTMTSPWAFSVTGAGDAWFVAAGNVSATNTGPQIAAAGTITSVVDSIAGWEGVVNIIDASLGRNQESDGDYKARHATAAQSRGFATVRGLASQLALLDGVVSVRVYMNTGLTTDADGRPGKSFEAVVQGGTTTEIAETIWLSHTTGTESYGGVQVVITDQQGNVPQDRAISFSRPVTQHVHVRITITRGVGFPSLALSDAQSLLSVSTEAWGNALGIGRDVYAPEVAGLVTEAFDGISGVLVEMDATLGAFDTPVFSAGNLAMGVRDLPSFSSTRVQVVYA